jgi:hypothetical protein
MLRGGRVRRTVFAIVPVLVSLSTSAPARAQSFADALGGSRIGRAFASSLATSIGRALPVLSASPGVTYEYDPALDTFERRTSILGQLFLEQPEPIGKGHVNVNVSYQQVEFDTFQGKDLTALHDVVPFQSGTGPPFTFPRVAIKLDTQEATVSATYGVTDDLDVNLTLPVVYSRFRFDVAVGFLGRQQSESRTPPSQVDPGDLFLRGKYRLLTREWLHAAFGLVLRLPTGNENNFQGTGAVELAPMLYLSRDLVRIGRHVRLRGYMNGGVNVDADNVDGSEGRWGTGVDCGVHDWLTVGVAVLGRHSFSRLGPPGLFQFIRQDGRPRALFGFDSDRTDFYDLSVGGRVNLWRETVIGFGNVVIPLNRDGFRADAIPLLGLEVVL